MKRHLCLLLAATVPFAACASDPQRNHDDMVAAARALDAQFVDAFNRGDADALSSLSWNSPDAVLFPPDAVEARGIEAIRQANARSLAAMGGAKIELTESHQMVAGDMVIGYGKWRLTMTGPDGAPVEIIGRHTDVKAERDGKWVYLVDHASVPLAPPQT